MKCQWKKLKLCMIYKCNLFDCPVSFLSCPSNMRLDIMWILLNRSSMKWHLNSLSLLNHQLSIYTLESLPPSFFLHDTKLGSLSLFRLRCTSSKLPWHKNCVNSSTLYVTQMHARPILSWLFVQLWSREEKNSHDSRPFTVSFGDVIF